MTIQTPTLQRDVIILSAINSMLSTIGQAPVNSLSSGLVDAETAEVILDEVSRDVQSLGWNFNSEVNFQVIPDDAGHIVLPTEVVRADPISKYRRLVGEYIQRGNKMYDLTKHTYVIDKPLLLDVIVLLPFEQLPEVARRFITTKASRLFQERVVGSDTLSAMNRADEEKAFYALKEMEGDNGDYNIFDDYGTAGAINRSI